MPTIKRYANRKLYDTEARGYVTLEGLAELIRQGVEIQVLDHTSGEDITAQIQAQIIYEEEKRRGGVLPRTLFTDLIQTGTQKLTQLRHTLTPKDKAGQAQVEAEIERRITALMERGDLSESEGLRLLDLLLTAPATESQYSDAEVERLLLERALPTRQELDHLARQVEALQAEIAQLGPRPQPAKRKAKAKKR